MTRTLPLCILITSCSGIGLTAKSAEAGGISLIIIYNRYLVKVHDYQNLLCTNKIIIVAASAWLDVDLSLA